MCFKSQDLNLNLGLQLEGNICKFYGHFKVTIFSNLDRKIPFSVQVRVQPPPTLMEQMIHREESEKLQTTMNHKLLKSNFLQKIKTTERCFLIFFFLFGLPTFP